jgi:hypothetical protein
MRIESGQEPIFKRDSDLQLYVRADHRNPEGQAPRCYVATGAELLRSARRVAQQQGRGRQRPPPGGAGAAACRYTDRGCTHCSRAAASQSARRSPGRLWAARRRTMRCDLS